MSDIATIQPTMSSREIAALVESTHPDVKRSIERLAAKGVIAIPPSAGYLDSLGRAGQTEYLIGKRDSYVIVAQLSPEFTARLVDRWQELEASAGPAIPQSFAAALRLAAEQQEQIEQQAAALALAAPKVAFVERYVAASTGALGFRQVAKLLGANEARLREWLLAEKIMYRLAGVLTPHQNHIDAGRFEVRTGEAQGHVFEQAKFSPKGIAWLAGLWAVHGPSTRASATSSAAAPSNAARTSACTFNLAH